MNSPTKLALLWVLAAGLVAGCSRNPADPVASGAGGDSGDQAEVSEAMASAPELVDDGQFESAEPTRLDDGVQGRMAAIDPFYFIRKISRVETRYEIAFADTDTTGRPTTAIVTVHRHLAGTFNIAARSDGDTVRVQKPLADHWVRRILLKRVPLARSSPWNTPLQRPRWRVAGSSDVDVTSRGATTRIVSLEIKTADRDTVIVDPLALFRLRQIMKFEAGQEVTLIVTTRRNDDVVVLLRGGLRTKFTNNGDNTYTLAWHAPPREGLRHAGVNALSNGTLFDDQAPYDSEAWIVPYVVSPTVLADYIP